MNSASLTLSSENHRLFAKICLNTFQTYPSRNQNLFGDLNKLFHSSFPKQAIRVSRSRILGFLQEQIRCFVFTGCFVFSRPKDSIAERNFVGLSFHGVAVFP